MIRYNKVRTTKNEIKKQIKFITILGKTLS